MRYYTSYKFKFKFSRTKILCRLYSVSEQWVWPTINKRSAFHKRPLSYIPINLISIIRSLDAGAALTIHAAISKTDDINIRHLTSAAVTAVRRSHVSINYAYHKGTRPPKIWSGGRKCPSFCHNHYTLPSATHRLTHRQTSNSCRDKFRRKFKRLITGFGYFFSLSLFSKHIKSASDRKPIKLKFVHHYPLNFRRICAESGVWTPHFH